MEPMKTEGHDLIAIEPIASWTFRRQTNKATKLGRSKLLIQLEAAIGIEPMNKGFAVLQDRSDGIVRVCFSLLLTGTHWVSLRLTFFVFCQNWLSWHTLGTPGRTTFVPTMLVTCHYPYRGRRFPDNHSSSRSR